MLREQEQYSELAFSHPPEQESTLIADGYESYPQEPPYSVGQYLENS